MWEHRNDSPRGEGSDWGMRLGSAPGLPVGCYLQTVEEEALIKNNNTCKDFLIEAMKYHLLPQDQRLLIKNPRTKPRTPVSLPKVSPSPASASCWDCVLGKWPSAPAFKVFLIMAALLLGCTYDLRDGVCRFLLNLLVPLFSMVFLS